MPVLPDPPPLDDWLRLERPLDGALAALGLSEVRGSAGARRHDVVVAIDASDSTLLPSGWDVDGDGPDGTTSEALLARLAGHPELRAARQRAAEEDLDDCVLMAELAAVSALVARFDPAEDRVGLLVFSKRAFEIARLGSSPEELRGALERVPDLLPRLLGGTDFARALGLASASLVAADAPGRGSIVFLSDGAPTLPVTFPGLRASTLDAARRVASWGQRIHAFALGDAALAASELYEELAELTDGSLVRLEAPGDLIARLRRVVLTDVEHLEVRNDSSGLAAMALRIHPNGSFDAFVPLTPGENRLVVRALLSDGSQASVTRSVRYEPQDTPEQQAQLKVLMQELERRTLQLELWAEMERTRRLQRKVIQLELGEPTP